MRRVLAATLVIVAVLVVWARRDVLAESWALWRKQAHPPAPTVILVVLDTVRADHLHACGYGRPNTPALDALVAGGATLSCRAYSPATWTLPGHASLFTGLSVPEHGSDNARGEGTVRQFADNWVRPLAPEFETVAETLSARGYQALLLSENPVLADWSGLTQGFAATWAAPQFSSRTSDEIVARLGRALRKEVDPSRPLFVVLNLSEAHDPLPAVPAGVPWVAAHPELRCWGAAEAPCWRYERGEMSVEEAKAYREWQVDSYDWGIARADTTLARLLGELDTFGWRAGEHRLVVVADHGELLGEHGVVGHGDYVYEPITRVPLLVGGIPGLVLPDPVSTAVVPSLLRDGRLPDALPPLEAVGNPGGYREANTFGRVPGVRAAARWEGEDKHVWIDGRRMRFDLGVDPGEERPLEPPADPRLDALAQENLDRFTTIEGTSSATTEQLRALGYVK